jgi:hypothetical protein
MLGRRNMYRAPFSGVVRLAINTVDPSSSFYTVSFAEPYITKSGLTLGSARISQKEMKKFLTEGQRVTGVFKSKDEPGASAVVETLVL